MTKHQAHGKYLCARRLRPKLGQQVTSQCSHTNNTTLVQMCLLQMYVPVYVPMYLCICISEYIYVVCISVSLCMYRRTYIRIRTYVRIGDKNSHKSGGIYPGLCCIYMCVCIIYICMYHYKYIHTL
jgi:hypothetical protein